MILSRFSLILWLFGFLFFLSSDTFIGKTAAVVAEEEMVFVPAGEFLMGSENGDADEKPSHRVFLDAFFIDKYEVTNARFQEFIHATKYATDAEKTGSGSVLAGSSWKEVKGAHWRAPYGAESNISDKMNHPVGQISWNDAKVYCEWAGKRLPTEAEWEKAARGTDGRKNP